MSIVSHRPVVIAANLIALGLLLAALFGHKILLDDYIGIHKSLREVAVALWALLVPGWFTIEERWAPPSSDQSALEAFRTAQQTGRTIWSVVGAAVFTVVLAAPTSSGIEQAKTPGVGQSASVPSK